MNRSHSFTIFFSSSFFIFIFACAHDDHDFLDCKVPFNCGGLDISYPFWGNDRPENCGLPGFKLRCIQNRTMIMLGYQLEYQVVHINPDSHTFNLSRFDVRCAPPLANVNLSHPFSYSSTVKNLTLFYNCTTSPFPPLPSHNFSCPFGGTEWKALYTLDEINNITCRARVKVPVEEEILLRLFKAGEGLDKALEEPFGVNYHAHPLCDDCEESGGKCGTNLSSSQFVCFCPDGHQRSRCHDGKHGSRWKLKVGVGVSASFGSVAIMCFIFYLYLRHIRKQNPPPLYMLSRSIFSYPSSVRDREKGDQFSGVHTFSYSELREATRNFHEANELGDGGFGAVYKGKLRDGRIVAVKRLYENNYKRVEQFLNEVRILANLRHPHLVALYGCTSRRCRELLLVYEYVPNGTVADHLHGERAKPGELRWPTRLKIAIETATALAYLHANDVIHRDVKTNNILLDNNFSVKVADFGLSRLFPTDVTHVSTAPQGTPGYVDPEYYQCYQLTSKSDVFSFGVVLIELISSMPAVDITRHRHEINLANMAISKIENRALHELVDPSLGFEAESSVRNMITAVAELAFQCVQSSKEMRPSMVEVLESLKRIQGGVYNAKKAGENDIPSDDVVLLKCTDLQLINSPDSATMNLVSGSKRADVKAGEIDNIPANDVVLLKSTDLQPRTPPDSATVNWVSV